MGCFSHRVKAAELRPEQKWDYISLNDFKSAGCGTTFAYGYLYFSLILSVALYGVDIFTAINLLAFDRWSPSVKPDHYDILKWVFAASIIASFINLGYEHIRARRIMKRGSVAECYLDSLAVRLESVRMGKGQGWKRFLVFAELTKSKQGAEYVALFAYFSFQAWIRVFVCSGPRQAVNALTLYAVWNAKDVGTSFGQIDTESVGSTLSGFFTKIGALASQDPRQSLILCGMLFSMIIWLFSFVALLLGVLFWVFYLSCSIRRSDGGLSGFCERKINKRLMKIVSIKVNKAIAEEERLRLKAGVLAAKRTGEKPPLERQATIPNLEAGGVGGADQDKLPEMPMLNRNDTMTTLPPYTSRPGTPGTAFELDTLDQKRPMPSRSNTSLSTTYSARAPLLPGASEMGYGRSASPAPSVPSIDMNNYPAPLRSGTAASNRSMGPGGMMGGGQGMGMGIGPQRPGLDRSQTNASSFTSGSSSFSNGGPGSNFGLSGGGGGGGYTASPATYSSEAMPSLPPPVRSPTTPLDGGMGGGYGRAYRQGSQGSLDSNFRSGGGGGPGPMQRPHPAASRPTYDDYGSAPAGRASPGPMMSGRDGGRNGSLSGMSGMSGMSGNGMPSPRNPPNGAGNNNNNNGAYLQQPMRSATNPAPMPRGGPPQQAGNGPSINLYPAPQRNMTAPVPQRQQTAPPSSSSGMGAGDDYFTSRPPPSVAQQQRQGSLSGMSRGPQQQQQQQQQGGDDYYGRQGSGSRGPQGGYGYGDLERGGPRY